MSKLSKPLLKAHNKALEITQQDKISYDDKFFVYENYHEGATNINSQHGAFFTPIGLAQDFHLTVVQGKQTKIIDLCAGIGMLSFIAYHYAAPDEKPEITCVEINPQYIEIGKKLLPEATWIQGSVMDKELMESLGHFDQAISNPPFGKIKHTEDVKKWLSYKGSEFEFKVMEVAGKIADLGTFIVLQGSTPFKYSGCTNFETLIGTNRLPSKVEKFINETGYTFKFNVGIDTSIYKEEWKGVSPICEIVNIDYSGKYY